LVIYQELLHDARSTKYKILLGAFAKQMGKTTLIVVMSVRAQRRERILIIDIGNLY